MLRLVLLHSMQTFERSGGDHRIDGSEQQVILTPSRSQFPFRKVGRLGKVGPVICGENAVGVAVASLKKTFKINGRGTR
jgi:hypothetical protein